MNKVWQDMFLLALFQFGWERVGVCSGRHEPIVSMIVARDRCQVQDVGRLKVAIGQNDVPTT